MNTKKKWTKWVSVAVLVLLASVFTAGLVAAVPGIPLFAKPIAADTPPVGTNESSWVRFEQYMAASSPEEYKLSTSIPVSNVDSWSRFEQYMAVSEPQEYRITSAPTNSWRAINDSWARFELYLEHSQ